MKVGDKVVLRPINNNIRYGTALKEGIISDIGRKYFDVPGFGKFEISTMRQRGEHRFCNWKAYKDMQQLQMELQHEDISHRIRFYFSGVPDLKDIHVNDLNTIAKILNLI
jgi:hypothetical protein